MLLTVPGIRLVFSDCVIFISYHPPGFVLCLPGHGCFGTTHIYKHGCSYVTGLITDRTQRDGSARLGWLGEGKAKGWPQRKASPVGQL